MDHPVSLGEMPRGASAAAPLTTLSSTDRGRVALNIRRLPPELDRHVWAVLGNLAAQGPFESLVQLRNACERVAESIDWGMPELSPMIGCPIQLAVLRAALERLRISREADISAANLEFTERVTMAKLRGKWCLIDEALTVQERAVELTLETYAIRSAAAFASALWGASQQPPAVEGRPA